MKGYKDLCKKNLIGIVSVCLLTVVASFAMVFAGYSLSFLFTAYESSGDKVAALVRTFGLVTAIWLAAMFVYYLSVVAKARIARTIKTDLREMIGEKIASLNYNELVSGDSGNYVSWLTNDANNIYEQSFEMLFVGVEQFAAAVFSLCALFMLSLYIGLVAVGLFVVIAVMPAFTNKKLQRANALRSKALEVSTESYKDVVMGSSIFYLNGLQKRIVERIKAASETAERVEFRATRTKLTAQTLIQTVSMISQCVLLLVSFVASVIGSAPTGAILSVGNLAGSFFNGVGACIQCFMVILSAKPIWEKFAITKLKTNLPTVQLGRINEMKFEDVSFSYASVEGASDDGANDARIDDTSFIKKVLENKNLTFRSGGKYAIVGESGSGKSTLVKILLGLIPDYTGKVLYNDVEQREVSLMSLYEQVAYLEQQVYLFQDTVRFNIGLGLEFSDEEIMEVARRCRIAKWIESLPDGLNTVILENGKNLSGGQRQRIALARALIRNVQYVILDEGTSALDEANAKKIESDLLNISELGVVLITHHLNDCFRFRLDGVVEL